ncbi:MAG: MFS transporter, partial [Chloroflexi bacterium]|nr:MFS transporter [Chloroflexota bacterium]
FAMLRSPAVALIVLIAFLVQFAFFGFQSLSVLWTEKVVLAGNAPQSIQQLIGLMFTVTGIVGILTQAWLVGPLVRRFKEQTLVTSGVLITALSFGAMALIPSYATVLGAGSVRSVANGFSQPALVALLTYAAPGGQRGLVIGLLESFQSLGRILGPLLAGYLFEQLNPTAPIATAALVTALAFVVTLLLARVHIKRRKK